MRSLRNDFSTYTDFLTIMTIALFYCWEKLFILVNTWMIGKKLNEILPEK